MDKRGTREVIEAFVKFLLTPEAQREFAKVGFCLVNATVTQQTQKHRLQFKAVLFLSPIHFMYTSNEGKNWTIPSNPSGLPLR